MNYVSTPSSAVKPVLGDTPSERDLMLSALRVASAQARLVANQIDTIGASLRQKAICCKDALEWAQQEGISHWIKIRPGGEAMSGFDLWDYQIDNIDKIEAAITAGQAPLYVLPTGGGKTVVAAAVINRAVERGQRVLVLTHRREILMQTSKRLGIDHGLIQAGLNVDLEYPVQVASIQTLWARCMRSDKLSLPAADLIVIDEAHHIRARTWNKILDQYPKARRIGLTATPCRADGRGLGECFSTIIEGPQVQELIDKGRLVKTRVYAPVDPNLRGVETRNGDYVISQLSDRMNRDDLVGDIVSHWHKYGERRKTLVFCVDVAHSVHVRDEFLKSGVRAEHVDGSTPKPERDAILARLASGEAELVTNCMVLTEGFDLPAISCIVLARPTKQLGLFRQMAGRGLRAAPGKMNLTLIDHSGAVYRHGLLTDPIEWTLDVDRKAKNETHEARDKQTFSRLVECSSCGTMRTAGEPCDECGFYPQRRPDAVIFQEGELALLRNGQANSAYDPHLRMGWHAMLVYIAQTKGYKPGWAAHKYKEKFGTWPASRHIEPKEPSPEVLSWVRSRNIAYAKAKQKVAAA
jgi:DNA repair protein RadD